MQNSNQLDKDKLKIATLGSGCFWCTEAVFQGLKGVKKVTPGYTGGTVDKPTYEQVSSGVTGHAEALEIVFDPKIISYQALLDIFWYTHDPTTLNRQGADVGSQYRSVIFYHDQKQKTIAKESLKSAQKLFDKPILTQIAKVTQFYPAEEYHQNYYRENKNTLYCQIVINPKLQKLKKEYKKYLK